MGNIRKIGSYESQLKNYSDISVSGINKIDLGNNYNDYLSKSLDMNASDLGIDTDQDFSNRSFLAGSIIIYWDLIIEDGESGVNEMSVKVNQVEGSVSIEDFPIGADPSDPDVELEEFEVEFNANEMEFTIKESLQTETHTGIYPRDVWIDFNKKTIEIEF